MKYRMLLSPLWKIGSWKKLFLCGKKSLEKPTVEVPREIIVSEVLPRLHATVELPREIIEWEILPRLPAKSLRRFMCVCKHWKSHISTCEFIRKNLQHINKQSLSLTHCKVLEIDYMSKTFSTRDYDDFNNHDSTIVRSIPFIKKAKHVLLLASLDGLVFLKLVKTCEYVFWNPLTGAYKKLSNFSNIYSPFVASGLYFDSNEKDYKVLQWSCFGGVFKAFIYSKRFNSTKEILWLENHQRLSSVFWSSPISFGESLYFTGKGYDVGYRFWIIVFDVKSEKMREIRCPLLNQENPYNYASLMVIKGCIHIFVITCMKVGAELWRMDGDGDIGWTKVKDFPPAGNNSWTYDEKVIDLEDMELNFNRGQLSGRKILYRPTLVSPSC